MNSVHSQTMKYLVVFATLFAVVVSDYVSPQNGQLVFFPRNKKAVSQSEAREYCASLGGSLMSGFNVTTRDLIGKLFEHASDITFWVDSAKPDTVMSRIIELRCIEQSRSLELNPVPRLDSHRLCITDSLDVLNKKFNIRRNSALLNCNCRPFP